MPNWTCDICGYRENPIDRDFCKKCKNVIKNHKYIKIGDWTCKECREYNFSKEYSCTTCHKLLNENTKYISNDKVTPKTPDSSVSSK